MAREKEEVQDDRNHDECCTDPWNEARLSMATVPHNTGLALRQRKSRLPERLPVSCSTMRLPEMTRADRLGELLAPKDLLLVQSNRAMG